MLFIKQLSTKLSVIMLKYLGEIKLVNSKHISPKKNSQQKKNYTS